MWVLKMAVVAIINYQGKILIGKKKSSSVKFLSGKWHIPGETIQQGESDEEALIRGMKEETGLEIRVDKYIGSSITPSSKKEARWYECFSDTDDAVPKDDLEDLKWVSKKDALSFCGNRVTTWSKEILEYFQ